MMNLITWNCRGACSPSVPRTIKDFRAFFNVNFVALLEPRTSANKARIIIRSMGFNESCIMEAKGS